jgi:hypothetical protein
MGRAPHEHEKKQRPAGMTDDDFRKTLADLLYQYVTNPQIRGFESLFGALPEVYDSCANYWHNEVIEQWLQENNLAAVHLDKPTDDKPLTGASAEIFDLGVKLMRVQQEQQGP